MGVNKRPLTIGDTGKIEEIQNHHLVFGFPGMPKTAVANITILADTQGLLPRDFDLGVHTLIVLGDLVLI